MVEGPALRVVRFAGELWMVHGSFGGAMNLFVEMRCRGL